MRGMSLLAVAVVPAIMHTNELSEKKGKKQIQRALIFA
jgi:hypothetical protein